MVMENTDAHASNLPRHPTLHRLVRARVTSLACLQGHGMAEFL